MKKILQRAVILTLTALAGSQVPGAEKREAAVSQPAKAQAVDSAAVLTPKRVVIPKLSGKIVVDGELTEPVWASAVVIGPFVPSNGIGAERERTTVRAWYDDTALHLGWTCIDDDIQATLTARDSRFWEEEVAEFFITRRDLRRYIELQWNPLGGVFDAIIENTLDERGVSKGIKGDWAFTAKGMKSAVRLRGTPGTSDDQDEGWQVEVVIPFTDLGEATPQPGDVWRGNFYRFNRAKGRPPEPLSWSPPISTSFHQPSRFGFLEFGR